MSMMSVHGFQLGALDLLTLDCRPTLVAAMTLCLG
jgi:hypothetical protein